MCREEVYKLSNYQLKPSCTNANMENEKNLGDFKSTACNTILITTELILLYKWN